MACNCHEDPPQHTPAQKKNKKNSKYFWILEVKQLKIQSQQIDKTNIYIEGITQIPRGQKEPDFTFVSSFLVRIW